MTSKQVYVVELETLAPAACVFRILDDMIPIAANYELDGEGGTGPVRRKFRWNVDSLRSHLSVNRFESGAALAFTVGQMAALRAEAAINVLPEWAREAPPEE